MAQIHKIPDAGYAIAKSTEGRYLAFYSEKPAAVEAAQATAEGLRSRIDLVKIQNRGVDRFIIAEFEPRR